MFAPDCLGPSLLSCPELNTVLPCIKTVGIASILKPLFCHTENKDFNKDILRACHKELKDNVFSVKREVSGPRNQPF
jgi:hypothetical protein